MGFGKACLSVLVVSVVVAWTTNATAQVTRGVILRVTFTKPWMVPTSTGLVERCSACWLPPESVASGVTAAAW